jgi:RHS repeat-associated protein
MRQPAKFPLTVVFGALVLCGCSGVIEGAGGVGAPAVVSRDGVWLLDVGEGSEVGREQVRQLDALLRSGALGVRGGAAGFGGYELELQPVGPVDERDSAETAGTAETVGAVFRAHWACEPVDAGCRYIALQGQGVLPAGQLYTLTLRSTSVTASVADRLGFGAALVQETFATGDAPSGLGIPKDLAVGDGFSGRASTSVPFSGLVGGPKMGLSYSSLQAEAGRAPKYESASSDAGRAEQAYKQRAGRKAVSAEGRGWKLDGVSYLVGIKPEQRKLVLGGALHELVHAGGSQYRTREHSGLRVDWHHDASVTVYGPDGSVYEFGGFATAATLPDLHAMRSQYRCHTQRDKRCADENMNASDWQGAMRYKTRQGYWARNRMMAINPWTQFSMWVRVNSRGEVAEKEYRPYRLYLRKATDATGRSVHYFYNQGVAHTEWAPHSTEVRLARVVWGAPEAAMQQHEASMRQLSEQALRVARTHSNPDTGIPVYAMQDCKSKDDRFEPFGENDHHASAGWDDTYNGQPIGCSQYPGSDGSLPSIAERLRALEAERDALSPRMELTFDYGTRRDGIYENENDANHPTGYEAFSGKYLREVAYRTMRGGTLSTLRGWSIARVGGDIDHDRGDRIECLRRNKGQQSWRCDHDEEDNAGRRNARNAWQNIARITPWVGSADNPLPALRLEYHDSTPETPQYQRGLLKAIYNGFGGHTELIYQNREGTSSELDVEDDKYVGLGLVQEVRDFDGTGNHKRVVFERALGMSQGRIDGQWGGSRQVMTKTYQTTAGGSEVLESCTEQRYFTNNNDGAAYKFADGTATEKTFTEGTASTVSTATNDRGDSRIHGLQAKAYQSVQWLPSATRCPALSGYDQATSSSQGATAEQRTYYVVHKDPKDSSGELASGFRTDVRFQLSRALLPSSQGLAAPSYDTWAVSTYDDEGNPLEAYLAQGTLEGPGATLETKTVRTYYPRPADAPHRLAKRLKTETLYARSQNGTLQQTGYSETTYLPGISTLPQTVTTSLDDGTTSGSTLCSPIGRATTRFAYDAFGNQTLVTDALGNTSRTEYDEEFHLLPVRSQNALGHTTQTTYGSSGYHDFFKPVRVTGPFVASADKAPFTETGYDALGRPAWSRSSAASAYSTTSYQGTDGQVGWSITSCALATSSTDAAPKRCSTSTLNGWGATTKQTSPDGPNDLATSTVYDGLGRAIKTSMPYAASGSPTVWASSTSHDPTTGVSTTVDAANIATRVCPFVSLGTTETRTGASADDTACSEDFQGRKSRASTDAFGRTTAITDYNDDGSPATTSFTYDGMGRPLSVTDALGRARAYRYNWAGLQVHRQDPDAGTTETCYNQLGQNIATRSSVSQAAAPAGSDGILRTEYDSLGRVTRSTAPANISSQFFYDERDFGAQQGALGKLTRAISTSPGNSITKSLFYDAHGRVIRTRHAFLTNRFDEWPSSMDSHTTYDAVTGEATCQDFPAGSSGSSTSVLSAFDPHTGRLTRLSLGSDACERSGGTLTDLATNFVYTLGQLTQVHNPADGHTQSRTYDPTTGRLSFIGSSINGLSSLSLTYAYDPETGDILSLTEPGLKTSYAYDSRARLTSASFSTSSPALSFAYDALGNLQHFERATNPLFYDAQAKLTALGGSKDAPTWQLSYLQGTGLVTQKTRTQDQLLEYQLGYNPLGQVSTLRTPARSLERVFGPDGLAILRITPHDPALEPARTLYFGPAGYEEEHLHSGSTLRRLTIQAPMGPIVLQAQGSAALTLHAVAHTDHLGSPRALSGTLDSKPAYSPFGSRTDATGLQSLPLDSSSLSTLGFTGHRSREAEPLIDMNARFYDPSLGRFLQPDPVIPNPLNPQDYNAYAYVRNNPIATTDSTGMWPDWGGFADAVGGIFDTSAAIANTLNNVSQRAFGRGFLPNGNITQSQVDFTLNSLGVAHYNAPCRANGINPRLINRTSIAYHAAGLGLRMSTDIAGDAIDVSGELAAGNYGAAAALAGVAILPGSTSAARKLLSADEAIDVAKQVRAQALQSGAPNCMTSACTVASRLLDPTLQASPAPSTSPVPVLDAVRAAFPNHEPQIIRGPLSFTQNITEKVATLHGEGAVSLLTMDLMDAAGEPTRHAATLYNAGGVLHYLDPGTDVYVPWSQAPTTIMERNPSIKDIRVQTVYRLPR